MGDGLGFGEERDLEKIKKKRGVATYSRLHRHRERSRAGRAR